MLYEGKDFTLANNITSATKQEGRSLNDIMDKIRAGYVEESDKTKEYVENSFNLLTIADDLFGYMKKTTFTYQDFLKLKLDDRGFFYSCVSWFKSRSASVSGAKK